MTSEITLQTRTTHPWVAEGQHKIRLGILANFYETWKQTIDVVQMIEDLGFDSIWIYDHPIIFGAPECWVTLATLATKTHTIRLGSAVSCIYYRHPAILARSAADVDRLSDGRLILGLGIGDVPEEFAKMGLTYGSIRERQEALAETVEIVQGLWSHDTFTYEGKHFQVIGAQSLPHPIQQPGVPLLIGGGGERVTLKQVAQYADMSNFGPHEWTGSAFELADIERKYAALRTHCDTFARPYNSILRSHFTPTVLTARTQTELDKKLSTYYIPEIGKKGPIIGLVDEVTTHLQHLVNLGVQYFIMWVPGDDPDTLQILMQDILPTLQLPD